MRVISLFAGIGGIDFELECAGMTTVGQVEIDQAARGVLADHWPDVARFPDVGEVTPDDCVAAGFVPGTGVIAGGFPCQDLSVAGRRAGLGGARSGLFWEIVRLADALRPQWLVLENVPGLLSAVCPCPGDGSCVVNGRDIGCAETLHTVTGGTCRGGCMETHGGAMGAVLGALGDLGYGYAYRVLDAQHFGVPQRRRRVFIVGCLGDGAAPVRLLLEPASSGGHPAPSRTAGPHVAALLARGADGRGRRVGGEGTAGQIVTTALTTSGSYDDQEVAGRLVPFDAAQLTSPENRLNPRPGDPSMPLAATGQPMIAHTLTAEGHDASEDGSGRGTPLVSVGVGLHGETSYGGRVSASVTGSHGQPPAVIDSTAVRRLTPRECERLQGFPDDWTLTSNGKPQADSPQYRQLGNAVAVPVMEWIGLRMLAVERERGAA